MKPEQEKPLSPERLRWLRLFYSRWLERIKMHEHLFDIGVAIIIGVLCGMGAVAFRYLIGFCHQLFWGHGEMSLEMLEGVSAWRKVIVPAIGGLLVGPLVYFFAREAKGHGVPEVMLAVAQRKGVIRTRVAAIKALASAFTIGSGGSAGREGPIIQIGSAIGSWVGQRLQVSSRKLRTFVGCGAAGGIAATFNAPIAGALFSVEVILGDFGVAEFGPIVISSVIATVLARHYFGGGPVFEVPSYELVSGWELLPYLLLGLLCGMIAHVYKRALYRSEDFFNDLSRVHEMIRPALWGMAVGLLGMWVPNIFGDGYDSVSMALQGELPLKILLVLLLVKMLATSLTLGSGGSGGVFAPSLFLGAMAGGVLGTLVSDVFGQSAGAAGGYALVAMGGVVAAATQAPISAILIIFEITYDYDIILPLMTVCIISTVTARWFEKESIYTLKLVRRGIDIFGGRSLDLLRGIQVANSLDEDIETFRAETRVRTLMDRMIEGDRLQFYITGEEDELVGVVTLESLRRVLLNREGLENILLAEDLADERVEECYPHESFNHALLKFERGGLTELPVVDPATHKLLGALHYRDVIAVYNAELLKRDSAEGMVERVTSAHRLRKVKLLPGFSLIEWEPPSSLWGKTLAEADLPARFGVRVILIKRHGAREAEVVPELPGRDYTIRQEDTLLVYGTDESLEKIQRL